jgi:DsbC/DsbD-like thiol-disulfide interchange protein/cytochrome c biogenesis protein CcdA
MAIRFLLLVLALLTPSLAGARTNAIQPELVAEGPANAGGEVELAIVMHTRPGWHGYWLNPGDAGLPMTVEWRLPPGASAGPLRYPVPSRLTISGLMNYVYERDYALLTRLKVPPGAKAPLMIAASARWLACTDKICVPEQGEFSLVVPAAKRADPRFNAWRQALPRPLATTGRFALERGRLAVAIPLPASVLLEQPYLFPITDGVVDYQAKQGFRRAGDTLIADLARKGTAPVSEFAGVLALGDGRGLEFRAVPGSVPAGGKTIGQVAPMAILWAVLGAIAGGLLLNLMPCVFPILALKALALARAGGDERSARRDALAYAAGAIVGTGALGFVLLLLRAGGSAAGWAFQLQDPRTILLLLMLGVAITLNLVGLYRLPVVAGEAGPKGAFATGALAAFVATPCAGPFLGAALGTALLLPPAGAILVFAALGAGLALPFIAVAFIPALRRRLPRPGPWTLKLQRFLAIPMAATVAACLWLLWRQSGSDGLWIGLAAIAAVVILLLGYRAAQAAGRSAGATISVTFLLAAFALGRALPPATTQANIPPGAQQWSEARVAALTAKGRPTFVYFTADWCLTCKVNEAGAIERAEVRAAFRKAGVEVLAGDWTNGDPAITRFLDRRGRAGVPLYLWYEPGKAEPEELPQVLTPAMLIARARQSGR